MMAYVNTRGVYDLVKVAMDEKTPFSLVRLGDGEARLIGYPEHITRGELNQSLAYWYGPFQPEMYETMQLRQELMAAVRNADVVGLPSMKQQQKKSLYKLVHYLVRKHGLLRADVAHCGVHRRLQETGLLADLVDGLSHVTVITCRDVRSALQDRLNVTDVTWLSVPEEANTGVPVSAHYPSRHTELLRELDVGPGDLVLVGAGPNGKVYCDAAKRKGSIALDLGSVFDGWKGISSRSYIARDPERYRL